MSGRVEIEKQKGMMLSENFPLLKEGIQYKHMEREKDHESPSRRRPEESDEQRPLQFDMKEKNQDLKIKNCS